MALGFASESDAFAHFFAVFCAVSLECAVIECVADFLHKVVVEPQIVHDEQPLRQHFTALEQVAQISAAEPLTGRALTAFFNRAVIGLVLGIHNVQDAVMREQMTVTRVAGRHNAVEEINAASDTFNNVARCADTHQVARLILGRMRQNNIDISGMRELNERRGGKHIGHNREMLQLIEPLYNAYIGNFRTTQGIDFPGMIVDAVRCVQRNEYRHPYKYVLIDEYQDMSRPRYELIRALHEQNDFTLFCVGDDWQSIYRFAGSDIHLILDFAEIWRDWGPTRMFQITTTRRFRQSLIDASGKFVMQDKNLYVKRLHNPSDKKDHSLKALGGSTQEERFNAIVEQLRKLPKAASVLMLGRYRSDLNLLLRNDCDGLFQIDEHTGSIVFLEKPDMDITFMTAHKSKGLQRDFVFLLCCSGGLKGFPSAIPDEPLLGLLLPEVERMPHAEERRLFYVAMTRCKKKLFFVVDQSRPSRFMYELHDRICPNIFRGVKLPPQCPNCGEALRLRHAGSDPSRAFYGCTGFPNCRYSRECR